MPKFLANRWHGLHMLWLFAVVVVLAAVLFVYEWIIGLIGLAAAGGLAYYAWLAERAFRRDLNEYVGTLSHRIKRAGGEVIHQLPIGIVLYNEERVIEWHNPYVGKMLGRESVIGELLPEHLPVMRNRKDQDGRIELALSGKVYEVQIKAEERLLYIRDITEFVQLGKKYEADKLSIGILMLDNLDEVTQGMDEQSRSIMLAKVVGEITEWSNKHKVFIKRVASDRFMLLMRQTTLVSLEQTKFEILDDVRELTIEYKIPITLSIGIAAGMDGLTELGQMAQSSLELALGRGGDQVAVRSGQRLSFYGGRSNAVEKRTRVRARVISYALRDLIRESDKVVIMGHRMPDMDAVGAAIGVWKAAAVNQKEGYIVLEGSNASIQRLMEVIREDEHLNRWFISPEQAQQIMTPKTLAVVVDTHKASMVAEPRLLQQTSRIVVIDHHRRGEEFLNEATLVYMEPYASSTSELVTELLQYSQERVALNVLEATALLAGIAVDTKSFSLRTGARTFEAASYLRRNGADSALIQRLLKEDLEAYIRKSEIIRNAEIIYGHVALAVTAPGRKYSQLLIAQVADTLLNMTDIMASFVICERSDGLIGISARSLGQINVQVIMERLGGGGHLTNAATQIEGTLEQATSRLKAVLDEMEQEEGLFE